MRKTSALVAALGLIISLAACSSPGRSSTCVSSVTSGASSAVVTAPGKFGQKPVVSFPTPLYSTSTQRTELLPGHGAPLTVGQSVTVEATILNGADGRVLQTTSYAATGGSLVSIGPSNLPGLTVGLECARVGSRVAIVASPKDSTGGQGNPTIGLTPKDSLVFVIDIKAGFPSKASGAAQWISSPQIPAVVLAPNGRPGIILPNIPAPKTLQIAVEKQGNGPKIVKGQYAVLKYTGMLWADKSIFDSTWTNDSATVLQISPGTVVSGFAKGLIGQRVGSQVVMVIPPAEGYGSQGKSPSVPANATLVFVVDILGVLH